MRFRSCRGGSRRVVRAAACAAVAAGVGCQTDFTTGVAPDDRPVADSVAWVNPPSFGPPTLLAAGDVARCGQDGDDATAALLDTLSGTVLALGDHAYQNGTAAEYWDCFDPSWGRHRPRTRPAPGNHEYGSPGAAPYFAYFGSAAGPAGRGYYSFDVGAWHVVSLNSNTGMQPGSPQEQWLRADLAAHPARCTLAFWHHPRFSSSRHGSDARSSALWAALAEAGADVVLAGHDHVYERFAPLAADGTPDAARGIRSFVVGTGGADLYEFQAASAPGSEARYNASFGVLQIALGDADYAWTFIPVGGGAPVDRGRASCGG